MELSELLWFGVLARIVEVVLLLVIIIITITITTFGSNVAAVLIGALTVLVIRGIAAVLVLGSWGRQERARLRKAHGARGVFMCISTNL